MSKQLIKNTKSKDWCWDTYCYLDTLTLEIRNQYYSPRYFSIGEDKIYNNKHLKKDYEENLRRLKELNSQIEICSKQIHAQIEATKEIIQKSSMTEAEYETRQFWKECSDETLYT